MKDKEKQIEEMAKDIEERIVFGWRKELYIGSAEDMYKIGYRKLPKDSVVLSTEELKDMVKARTKCVENAIIRTRKETAEKILNEFANIKVNGSSLEDYIVAVKVVDKIDELAKQFGVEVEE